MGSGAKSYMRKGFLVWGNAQIFSPYLRRSLVICDFAPTPSEFPYIQYEENFIFFFISALCRRVGPSQVYFAGEEKSPIKVMLEDHALFHVQECREFLFTNSSLKRDYSVRSLRTMGAISNFYENLRRYSKAKVGQVNDNDTGNKWKNVWVFSYFVEMLLVCCLHS